MKEESATRLHAHGRRRRSTVTDRETVPPSHWTFTVYVVPRLVPMIVNTDPSNVALFTGFSRMTPLRNTVDRSTEYVAPFSRSWFGIVG